MITHGNRSWKHLAIDSVDDLIALVKDCRDSKTSVLCSAPGESFNQIESSTQFVFADLKKMNKVLRHETQDLVISVETGIRLGQLNDYLEQHNQWFPAVAPPDTTLLDLLNRGDGGLLEHRFGAIRDNVLGLEVVTGGGDAIKSGGIVVKNVTGYDTTKLFVGSHGTLGIAHVAHLRLYARPEQTASLLFQSSSLLDLIALANDLIKADLSLACCELIDLKALELLPELNPTDKFQESFALLIRLSGHEELLKELVPQISHFKKQDAPVIEISAQLADKLVMHCSTPRNPRIELSATVSQANKLFQDWWQQAYNASLQYRPSTGRLQIFPRDLLKLEQTVQSLQNFSAINGAPNTVALASSALHYEVRTQGSDLKKLNQIKASLKDRFDPARCLNSLAVL